MLTESLLIGTLSIASIGLRGVPVYVPETQADHQECVDEMKVCRYADFSVLAAHDFGLFRKLKDVRVGDSVRYQRRAYTVERIQIVHEQDGGVLFTDKNELKLQTCVPAAHQRLIVTAKAK
jgi:LPXTG-site transpeptidase (sortase) family protein